MNKTEFLDQSQNQKSYVQVENTLKPSHLIRAQVAAKDALSSNFFPCYSSDYIASEKGLKGKVLWCYSVAYEVGNVASYGVYAVIHVVQFVVFGVLKGGDLVLGWAVRPVLDVVYPLNPINGHRHFVGIPRCAEKWLGDWIFYPLASEGMGKSHQTLPGTNVRIADKVTEVMENLKGANTDFLYPKNETTQFNYRVKTVSSPDLNAFAVPAGGMVVFSQIVKELESAIRTKQFQTATVEFADGSTATVDLSGVTLEDALAALMGHEMTHVASRHSIAAMMSRLILKSLLYIGRGLLIVFLKSRDPEYMELKAKVQTTQLKGEEQQTLQNKESLYYVLDRLLAWLEGQVDKFIGLFNSRTNEYEADVTGAFFAAKAGYNPLGALYLQEFLKAEKGTWSDSLHKNLEILYTHPYGENRKRAIFAALPAMSNSLQGKVQKWNIVGNNCAYDIHHSGSAFAFASSISKHVK
jgi:Zn-dependent protease with chaperone function